MSTQSSGGLTPQGYPSAMNPYSAPVQASDSELPPGSAFLGRASEQSPFGQDFSEQQETTSLPSAFDETATLPGNFSTGNGERAEPISDEGAAQFPSLPVGGLRGGMTGILPLVTPEQISDPVLRAKLSRDAPSSSVAEDGDPFGTASLEPVATGLQPTVYPSASPQTTNIPIREYKKRSARSGSRLGRSIKSFVKSQETLTQPLRGVANVVQRQFTLTAHKGRDQYVQEKEQAREVLNFTVRLAEMMFHYGADARDVDSAIVAICATYGLEDVEVNVTNQSVIVNYISEPHDTDDHKKRFSADLSQERFSHTVVRVVRTRTDNYSSLTAIYELIHSITEKGLSRQQAERRLKHINRSKKPYSPLAISVSEMMIVGFFTVGLGGSWRAVVVAMLAAIVALTGMNLGSKLKLPSFFLMAIGSGIITAGALWAGSAGSFAQEIGFYVSSPHVVAAGLILLLPTSMIVSSAQDALTGYPLTAAGKFVMTALDFMGLVVGIAIAVTAMGCFDSATLDVQQTVFSPPPLGVSVLGMILGSMAAVIASQGTYANMLWIFLISGAGQAVYHGFSAITGLAPNTFTTAVAAFVVGGLSAYVAYKKHAPQLTFYVPGFLFLLPGLSIFRGLYAVIVDPTPVAGMSSLVAAFSTIIAMASGVVLGSYIVYYLVQKAVEGKNLDDFQNLHRESA